jgi:hypothetical protein
MIHAPLTLDELLAHYGDPSDLDFQRKWLVEIPVPFVMHYGAGPNAVAIARMRVHALAKENFTAVLAAIVAQGLESTCTEYNGVYAPRNIRGYHSHWSAHAWGLAIDLNASRLPLGSTNHQDSRLVDVFKGCGFAYGGEFKSRKDPMHFSLTGF